MTQDTANESPVPRPDLLEHVQRAVEGTRALQDDNHALRDELDRANASLAMERVRTEQLDHSLARSEALRDHYMRRATELEIALTTASSVIFEAIAKGKGGEFRGQGQLRTQVQEPAPASDAALHRLVAKIGHGQAKEPSA